MSKKQYEIIIDNLGEYAVLRHNGSIVITEIQNKVEAELVCDELNELLKENIELKEENERLKIIKNQYRGQKEYLLWAIERNCSKELFDTLKSYLIDVEDLE